MRTSKNSIEQVQAEMQRLVRLRESTGIGALEIAAGMQANYSYLRLVERGLAMASEAYVDRYRNALEKLSTTVLENGAQ